MRGVWAVVRAAVVAPVVRGARRANRWWDAHGVVTALVLPVYVTYETVGHGFRWRMAPFMALAVISLGIWGLEVAKLLRKAGRS
ncbi:hypothetical protein GCM10018785_65970 [Streptomyces longispororuber]|uniref:Uncharacterized protein n=1 Tax=Streptomyces longispororuber TaxID=68230 RepID=A0A919A954_9ACTN|nr:hypothetical protein [Streptomyces longispororuber]GHE89737.1 hypothetical protein GCM10018785_65970 [Streptomyces longispororuber]